MEIGSSSRAAVAGVSTSDLRILIVDDDAVDRMAIRRALDKSGLASADCEEASDAASAIALLTDRAVGPGFDCMILDYDLSGDTGMDVLRAMRENGHAIPVVMLTGRSDAQTAADLIKAGAADFLTKDALTPLRLEQAIRGAIRVTQAERLTQETQERFAIILGSIADAVITVDLDGRVTYMNPSAEALTGWTSADAVGKPFESIAFVIVVDTVPQDLQKGVLHAHLRSVLRGERTDERADMTLVSRDGRQLYVDASMRALRGTRDENGGAVVALRDITQRKRTEAALADAINRLQEQAAALEQQFETSRALTGELEQANEYLEAASREAEAARVEVETLNRIGSTLASELDVERIVQSVTDAATKLTGAQFGAFFYSVVDARGEQLTLYTLSGAPREAFETFGHPRPTPAFAPTLHGTGVIRSDDITKDPRYGHAAPHFGMPPGHLPVRSYLAVPVMSRTGGALGGLFFGHANVGVFTEAAERLAVGIASWAAVAMDNARLYEAERKARADAEYANKAKSDFLASMSHELRTPLNAIGGYAELLASGIRGPVTETQRADLERIMRNQHHLLSLINDILNFAKVEAGRVRLDLQPVALSGVLDKLEPLIAPQLLEKRLTYEYRWCDPSYTAYVDSERLQQILLNLLSNAVKFTPPEGHITVECSANPDTILIWVRDTGIGIPPDKLEQIFEPFVQLDRGQSATRVGTGLGLSISRDLARAMGGDLTVESELDVGSTFTLSVPRHDPFTTPASNEPSGASAQKDGEPR